MASNTPYVTVGDTPTCDACHAYYSERFCEDCSQSLCTWCNLDIHLPIGKRNHHRPRLYGVDKYAHLDGPAISTADRAIAEEAAAMSAADGSGAAAVSFTFDPLTNRVNVTTEVFLCVTAEEGWDLLGDFDCPYVPFSCDVNDAGDRRVLSLPPSDDSAEGEPLLVTEKLIQRDDREMFYSYSRLVPPDAGFSYSNLLSKFAFVPLNAKSHSGAGADKKCCLQWTTSVLPNDIKNHKEAAEDVASQTTHTHAHGGRGGDGIRCTTLSSPLCLDPPVSNSLSRSIQSSKSRGSHTSRQQCNWTTKLACSCCVKNTQGNKCNLSPTNLNPTLSCEIRPMRASE
jgi:hypothetical protein